MDPMTGKRRPRAVTPESLENAALHYLRCHASSDENLRRVLLRRIGRWAPAGTAERDSGAALVEALLARFRASGLLDDRVYAEGRAASLHRRGVSARGIRARLSRKGVAAEIIEDALRSLSDQSADPELAAAVALARRRRLGPYGGTGGERRQKDLAALTRAGFPFAVARCVVDCQSIEELEDGSAHR